MLNARARRTLESKPQSPVRVGESNKHRLLIAPVPISVNRNENTELLHFVDSLFLALNLSDDGGAAGKSHPAFKSQLFAHISSILKTLEVINKL